MRKYRRRKAPRSPSWDYDLDAGVAAPRDRGARSRQSENLRSPDVLPTQIVRRQSKRADDWRLEEKVDGHGGGDRSAVEGSGAEFPFLGGVQGKLRARGQ